MSAREQLILAIKGQVVVLEALVQTQSTRETEMQKKLIIRLIKKL